MKIQEIAQSNTLAPKPEVLEALAGHVTTWLANHPGEHSSTALIAGLQAQTSGDAITKLLYSARARGWLVEGTDYRRDTKRKTFGHPAIVWLGVSQEEYDDIQRQRADHEAKYGKAPA